MRKKYLLPALMFLMVMMGCGGGGDITSVLSSTKAITAFSLDGVSGTIDETGKTISLYMRPGTDVTHLVATFTTSGASVEVKSIPQYSGTMANDFTGAVVYTVTAADGTKQDYTVTVTVSTSLSGFPDTSFGTNGVVTTAVGNDYDYGTALAIQLSDGKIVMAGYSYNGSNYDFAVVRYNTDGSLDTTFGPDHNGKVTTPIGNGDDAARAVGIQSDGKIVVAGYYTNTSDNYNFAVVRYDKDGNLDPTFGTSGIVKTQIGSYGSVAYALAIDELLLPNRKIVVAGYSYNGNNNDFAVVRYNTDGSLDTTFGPDKNGKVTTQVGIGYDIAYALGIQPSDGRIVVAGASFNGNNNDFAVVRYDTVGSLDTTFGGDGIVTTAIGSGYDVAKTLLIQPSDNRIVVAGSSFNGSHNDFAMVRYNTDGSLDTSFGGDGIVTTPVGSLDSGITSLGIQPSDDKIVAAGISYNAVTSDFVLARYNKADGSLDTNFYTGYPGYTSGIVITSLGSGRDVVGTLGIQPSDGKIVVGGYYTNNEGIYNFALVRYWP